MKNILFDELKENEKTESWEVTKGDNLMNQFLCGNWSASVKEMIEENISSMDLINFLEIDEGYNGINTTNEHFNRAFFAELGNTKVRFN